MDIGDNHLNGLFGFLLWTLVVLDEGTVVKTLETCGIVTSESLVEWRGILITHLLEDERGPKLQPLQ